MSYKLNALLQHLLPKRFLTSLAGRVANAQRSEMTNWLIGLFVKKYGVDMSEALQSDTRTYLSFNEFFARSLKAHVRPLANADFVSPVDGTISQFGRIDDHRILQAKGHYFNFPELLGGDTALAEHFRHGKFVNLYLSPRDYHRVHMPCDGRLKRMIYIPGTLFSVNPGTARGIRNLFARNERVVCEFTSSVDRSFAMVLIGATIVGSIATVWHGLVKPKSKRRITDWRYADNEIDLKKGHEMGRFLLGSTVVMLFPSESIEFHPSWAPERTVCLGEPMGTHN